MKPLKIYLCDLAHHGVIVASDMIPINIGYIAAYAKKRFGKQIDVSLYKYPNRVIESIKNSRKQSFEMDFREFIKHLLLGRGYANITPPQLSEKIKEGENKISIIDLRESEKFETSHIQNALSSGFDHFLKEVLIDGKYMDDLDREMILVCDTGHMSRVAGAILAEEGFRRIYSLKGGMRRWNSWQGLIALYRNCKCSRLIDPKNVA